MSFLDPQLVTRCVTIATKRKISSLNKSAFLTTSMVLNKLKFSCFSKANLTSPDLHMWWNTITETISIVLEIRRSMQLGSCNRLAREGCKKRFSKESRNPCTEKTHTNIHPSQASIRHKSALSLWPHTQHHTACSICYSLTTGKTHKLRKHRNYTMGKIIFPNMCVWDDSAISDNASDGLSIVLKQVKIFSASNCCVLIDSYFLFLFLSFQLWAYRSVLVIISNPKTASELFICL